MVLSELKKRDSTLGRQRKDEYVNKLLAFQKKEDPEKIHFSKSCSPVP
jgi:tRNA-(ms[2]io[6]A)-hydroxylase